MKKIFALLFLLSQVAHASVATIPNDTLKLGVSATGNKVIELNIGSGSTNPKLRWNQTDSALQFSNDGTNFDDFGSGSGSGGGFSVLENPDFESGLASWSNSGGTFAQVTSGSNKLFGKGSATFDASATSQYFESDEYDLDDYEGLKGAACLGRILYKGGDSNLVLKVMDDADEVLASTTLVASTVTIPASVSFICPSSGTIRLRVESTANAAIIAVDRTHLGENDHLHEISQSHYYGGVSVPAACDMSNTGSPGHTDFVATCTGSTVHGGVTSFDEAGNGQVNLVNAPPGEYFVFWQGQYQTSVATTNSDILMTDGTTENTQVNLYHSVGTQSIAPATITGHFSYTVAGNRFFKLQGAGSVTHGLLMNNGEAISIFYYPSRSSIGVRSDLQNWNYDLKFAGANPAMSVATHAAEEVTDASLSATNEGTLLAQVPCSGTNPSTGLTCAAGDEGYGIYLPSVPRAGRVEVCADFTHTMQPSGISGALYVSFSIVKTTNSTQTVVATSGQQAGAGYSGAQNIQYLTPYHVCGQFTLDNNGPHTFRLFNQGVASGAAFAASVASLDSTPGSTPSNARFTVRPLDQQSPTPVFPGNITTPSSGSTILLAGRLDGTGAIQYQSGSWIASVYHPSPGGFELTFATPFRTIPSCQITGEDNASAVILNTHVNSVSTTTVAYYIVNGTPALVDVPHAIQCIGE